MLSWVPNCLSMMCCCLVAKLCLTLAIPVGRSDPMDCNPPASSVHGILQARILGWVVMPSSRESPRPRDRDPCPLCLLHWQAVLYSRATGEPPPLGSSETLWSALYASARLCLFFICPPAVGMVKAEELRQHNYQGENKLFFRADPVLEPSDITNIAAEMGMAFLLIII